MFEVAKDPTKSLLHSKCFNFEIQSYSNNLVSRKKSASPQKEIESLLDSLGDFLEAFDQVKKVSQIPLPKPKFEVGFTKAKDELFTHCYKDIVEHFNTQIRLSFRFEKNKTCVFPSKSLNITVINSFLHNFSTRVTEKPIISTRIDFFAYKCNIFEINYNV